MKENEVGWYFIDRMAFFEALKSKAGFQELKQLFPLFFEMLFNAPGWLCDVVFEEFSPSFQAKIVELSGQDASEHFTIAFSTKSTQLDLMTIT